MDKNEKPTNLELVTAVFKNNHINFFKNTTGQYLVTTTASKSTSKTNTTTTHTSYVESKDFELFLLQFFKKKFKILVSENQISLIISSIIADLYFDNNIPVFETFNRIGVYNKLYYYYLNDDNLVEFGKNHYKIVTSTKCKFILNSNSLPQVTPAYDPSIKITELMHTLYEIFNFKNAGDAFLFMTWLLYTFVPNTELQPVNNHILILTGQQGSGKTTALKMINRIISPSSSVFEGITNEENLVQVLSSNYITTFDNIRKISPNLQDVLCKACTGGTYTKRKLYTDNETVNINYKSVMCINGISSALATNSDFLDRSVLLELAPIQDSAYVSDVELWEKFNSLLPTILNLIFIILSKVIGDYRNLQLESSYRFCDFAKFGSAIGILFNYDFLKAYDNILKVTKSESIHGDIIIETITSFCRKKTFSGTASELILELNDFAYKNHIILPQNLSPKGISEKLMHFEGVLDDFGIKVKRRKSNGLRLIELMKED